MGRHETTNTGPRHTRRWLIPVGTAAALLGLAAAAWALTKPGADNAGGPANSSISVLPTHSVLSASTPPSASPTTSPTLSTGAATTSTAPADSPGLTPAAVDAAFPPDQPAATAGAAPCITVPVVASLENQDLVNAEAAAYRSKPRNIDGKCVTITVTPQRSGVAATSAASGFATTPAAQRPVVWLPDSPVWRDVARETTAGQQIVPADSVDVARTAIVLAMPQAMADALGWSTTPPYWQQVFAAAADPTMWADHGQPQWGPFRFGKTSPLVATSGLMSMAAEYQAAAGATSVTAASIASGAVVDAVRRDELGVSHYMATPEHFLWHARQAEDAGNVADFLSAVIVDEKLVWDYNRGLSSRDGITTVQQAPPAHPLVPVYPAGGSYEATSTAITLTAPWVTTAQRAAAADFVRFLGTASGQQVVRDRGFRDLHGTAGQSPAVLGHFADHVTAVPDPTPAIVSAIQQQFPTVRKAARVLYLVDVSGSMSATISPGRTKLDAARDAVVASLDYLGPRDSVGLAAFSNYQDRGLTPGLVAPVAPLQQSRAALTSALQKLRPISQTPLYRAVSAFEAEMARDYQPDMINAIVLLSDGHNDTTDPTTRAAMLDALTKLHHSSTPVLVFSLAYGADADTPTLEAIAKQSGAHYYDATDPTTIDEVLGDLVTSF